MQKDSYEVDVAKRVFILFGALCLSVCIALCVYLQHQVAKLDAMCAIMSQNFTTIFRLLEANSNRQTHLETIVLKKTKLHEMLEEIRAFNARANMHKKRGRATDMGGKL